jgi:hypothetical protein
MKISVEENRRILLTDIQNGVELKSTTGESLSIRECNGKFEIRINNELFTASGKTIEKGC